MNGPIRQGMHPAGAIGQSPNAMLSIGNPNFMQSPAHMGQPSMSQGMGVPQNINPSNPPMGMLSGGPGQPNVPQRYPMQPNTFLPHQAQQQRPAMLRQGQNPTQLNPGLNPAAMQNFHFPAMIPNQGPNNPMRRVASQPLGHPGIPPAGGANVAMMNMPPSMPGQMRQPQHPSQQNVRMQPQQQPLIQAEMRNQPLNSGLPQNMARNPSQGQVMNSLAQPPIIGSMQHPSGMQPPHLQNAFSNNGPMQSQHPAPHPSPSPRPTQNNPNMAMATPGPSHTPINRPSITPDNSFIGYQGGQFASTPNRLPNGAQANYPSFVPSSSPMPMDISQTSPGMMAQSTSNRSFSTQPMDMMNNGLDIYDTMPPPPSVPHPRPPSHTNPLPSPQQQPPQLQSQQLQTHHQSPPHSDQPTGHPQRPQSQPQQGPGRPPSQTATRTPRSTHMTLPANVLSGPLTATGRIPNPQQTPGQLVASMPPIAPRPPSLINVPPPQTPLNSTVPIPGDVVNSAMTAPTQRPSPKDLAGSCLARLLAFSGMLANDSAKRSQLHFWNELIRDFFTPKAVMKLTLWRDNLRSEAKPFEIGVPILPRFFLVTTQSGVKSMSLSLDGARERTFVPPPGQGGHTQLVVECVNAVWTYKYNNGYTVMLKGPLTVHAAVVQVNPPGNQPPQFMLRFEEFHFDANAHEKYISLDHIEGSRGNETPRPPALQPGPGGQIEEDIQCDEPRVSIDHGSIPGEPVNAFGIPQATMRCLELAESVGSMAELISFAKDNSLGPLDALKVYADKIRREQLSMGQVQQPLNPLPPNTNNNTSLGAPWPHYAPHPSTSIGHASAVTLYSSAPASVTNPPPPPPGPSQPQPQPQLNHNSQPSSSMNSNSPQNASSSSSSNSPEKQPKTIPQPPQQQQLQAPTPSGSGSGSGSGPATSPAVSSGGTTNNTPALANTSLKRKTVGGDATSPTVGNSDQQQPTKRVARKKGRTGTG